MEAIVLLFIIGFIFLMMTGIGKAIIWCISFFFKMGCFFICLFFFGFVFLMLMVGCIANLVK